MIVIITEEQKNLLVNKKYDEVTYFNPVQDIDDNWVVSKEEIDACTKSEFYFLRDLPLTEHRPKLINPNEV
jgi:hypothetical protein